VFLFTEQVQLNPDGTLQEVADSLGSPYEPNPFGGTQAYRVDYITVTAAAVAPVAAFTANTTAGTIPLTVAFTDQSSNAPTAWEWDLNGDGSVDSTEQNPVCEYPAPGLYTVVLNASNAAGTDTETKVDYINVAAGIAPNATTPAPAGFTALAETHGATWIRWTWANVTLGANETLVGLFDGVPVLNVSPNMTWPPTMYYAGDLNPNENHRFDLALVNNSTGTPALERVDLAVTTSQGSEFYYILFVVAIVLALAGVVIHNRYMAAVLLMFSFVISAGLAVGLSASNPSFMVIAVMAAVVTGLGMAYAVYDIIRSHVGWENDDY
jgi:hypothetical protein